MTSARGLTAIRGRPQPAFQMPCSPVIIAGYRRGLSRSLLNFGWRTPGLLYEVIYVTPRQQPRRRAEPARPGHRPGAADPQAIRRVGLETAFDPIRRRPDLHIPARRAGAAAPAHAGHPRGAHHPRDPLAADRDAGFGQFSVNPRRAVRAPAAGMNLPHAGCQLRISTRASRGWTSTSRVVPARGDTEHTGHRGDTETDLVRAHDPVGPGSGLPREPGRRFCKDVPLFAQPPDLPA